MNIEESELYAAELIDREEFPEAERLLASLADEGSVYALMALAWIYENGCLGSKNVRFAQYYYEQAISRESTDALLHLGLLLLSEDRKVEAQMAFERGAEKGHIGCSVELGWMLANGFGGPTRITEGREILEKASNKGHLFAQRRIISLDLAENPRFIKKISILRNLLVVAWKMAREIYRNRRSDKIW